MFEGILDISDALLSLEPNSKWVIRGGELGAGHEHCEIEWLSEDITQPSNSVVNAEVTRLQAEYDAQEYARNRKEDYPDWGSQFNKIYDDGLTKWKSEMVDPVKAKWPKNNSGPV